MISRRKIIAGSAVLAGGAILSNPLSESLAAISQPSGSSAGGGGEFTGVLTPNGSTLAFKNVGGVKVFHLIAGEVEHEFAPGLKAHCWGYNGTTPGPTIEAVEGDRVRIYVTNHLPAPTTVHWHGLRIPNGMDGVNGLTQRAINPGETFRYEFTLRDAGTFMYHPHFDEMTQQGMGMMGMFIIHPRNQQNVKVDRDYAIMLSEWRLDPGTRRPFTAEMTDFNLFTMNSKVYPATEALLAKTGERVRIRFGNLSAMDHHPIHLHGFQFRITDLGSGRLAESSQQIANSVLVPVGATRTIEFVADNPGDWPLHCHMTHHTMNQMGHSGPNMLGVDTRGLDRKVDAVVPGYMSMGQTGADDMMSMGVPANSIPMLGGDGPFGQIDMGGMFTILKVRDELNGKIGWYQHPKGTVADVATGDELRRDGIDPNKS